MTQPLRTAVLVPCYNEETAITKVIEDFRDALPHAQIYVYDNNSRDNTVAVAKKAGAIVRSEPLQGKGNVVRRMFADIEADIYVLVDGDATYDAPSAPAMIRKLRDDWTATRGGRAGWKAFHDEFLSYGGPPIPLVRQAMMKEDAAHAVF